MELYYVVLVIAFIAGLLAVEALYGMWSVRHGPEARRINARLRAMSAGVHADEAISLVKKRDLVNATALERALMSLPRMHRLDRLIVQSGKNISVTAFLAWTILAFAAGAAIGWLASRLFLFGLVVGVLLGMLPYLLLLRAKARRMNAILLLLPDSLDLVARALRAGHAFSGGIKMVADEMPEPIAMEFRETFDELNYGLALEDAMLNLSRRVDLPDIKYFVVSVLIQRETGGNLAAILDKIAALIRDRLRLLGRVRVLSTQGRMEAWILTILPFVVAGVMFVIWPQFMSILWTEPAGRGMVAAALVMMVVGIFIMWRMVKIRI